MVKLIDKVDWLTRNLQQSSHLCLPSVVITSANHHTPPLHGHWSWNSGPWANRVSHLQAISLALWTHLSDYVFLCLYQTPDNSLTVRAVQRPVPESWLLIKPIFESSLLWTPKSLFLIGNPNSNSLASSCILLFVHLSSLARVVSNFSVHCWSWL